MTDQVEEKKKPKKRRPAYKPVSQSGSIGSVSDAFSELQQLGEECREIVDNASDGLSQTQRIQTLGETADVLESLSEPDVDGDISDIAISYTEMVPTNKRQSPSRATRRDNAVAVLSAAKEELESLIDQHREDAEKYEEADEDEKKELEQPPYTVDQLDNMETLKDELDNIISDAENVEFPGMFG
jgi:hypothetical protein